MYTVNVDPLTLCQLTKVSQRAQTYDHGHSNEASDYGSNQGSRVHATALISRVQVLSDDTLVQEPFLVDDS